MGDLPAATNNELSALIADFLKMSTQKFEKFVFSGLLCELSRICPGRQEAPNAQIFIVRLYIAAFHIEVGETQTCHDGFGHLSAIDGDAIRLAIDIVQKVSVVLLGEKDFVLQIIFRTL